MAARHLLPLIIILVHGACEAARTDDAGPRVAEAAGASAGVVRLAAPADSAIPEGALGVSIRRGRALLAATRDSLPGTSGTSCGARAATSTTELA